MYYTNDEVRISGNNSKLYNNKRYVTDLIMVSLPRRRGPMKQILIQTTLTNPIFFRDASNFGK